MAWILELKVASEDWMLDKTDKLGLSSWSMEPAPGGAHALWTAERRPELGWHGGAKAFLSNSGGAGGVFLSDSGGAGAALFPTAEVQE